MPDVELHVPSLIVIAGGCSGRIGEVAGGLGVRRALLVTDAFMAERGPVPQLLGLLRGAGIETAVFAGVQPDPTTENVTGALEAFRSHGADGIVAVGGGSSLDTGKAAAVMATNSGTIADFNGYHQIPKPGVPLIGIPTTAGTGSEVTRVTVITDTERSVKMMLLDDNLLCSAALVDYELTLSCPAALTAHVGVDSLTHAIEAYVSSRANPVTDLWALEAARLIGGNLRRAYSEPGDREAREALALGATLAGMAFSNASVALVHGMSRPIGAHFHIAHGLSNALLLPEVTRYSVSGAPARYARIARELGAADEAASDEAAAAALVETLQALNDDLEVPTLPALGVERSHFDLVKESMAEAALASGSPGFNPRVPEAAEIVELYDRIYG
ncbi:MAG: iron-containing alcohol dehydrogenase [Gaiellaceae bacterium]